MVLARFTRSFLIVSNFCRNRHDDDYARSARAFYIFYVDVMTMVLARSVRALFFVLHFLRSCHDNGHCTLLVIARSARALFIILHLFDVIVLQLVLASVMTNFHFFLIIP